MGPMLARFVMSLKPSALCQLEPPMTIRNLEYALRPRSVAVIGASDDGGSVGEKLTENILGGGFAGPVYLVNPKRRRIAGQDVLSQHRRACPRRRTLRSSPRRPTPSQA